MASEGYKATMPSTVIEMLENAQSSLVERIERLRAELVPLERELANAARALMAIAKEEAAASKTASMPTVAVVASPNSPYSHLTMKELAVKALREQFPNGATAAELLDHFVGAWNRGDVVRSSLSPQLSRLKAEGTIKLENGNVWVLTHRELPGVVNGAGTGMSDEELKAAGILPSNATSWWQG
jgi:hypothetical protein